MSDSDRTGTTPTDFTDPTTIDVDEVVANINNAYRFRGNKWDDRPVWPNVTVKALADEVVRLRAKARPRWRRSS